MYHGPTPGSNKCADRYCNPRPARSTGITSKHAVDTTTQTMLLAVADHVGAVAVFGIQGTWQIAVSCSSSSLPGTIPSSVPEPIPMIPRGFGGGFKKTSTLICSRSRTR